MHKDGGYKQWKRAMDQSKSNKSYLSWLSDVLTNYQSVAEARLKNRGVHLTSEHMPRHAVVRCNGMDP